MVVFLYPLDEYFETLTQEEKDFSLHPKILPVIYRKGNGGKEKHYWAKPTGGILGKNLPL